MLAVGPAAWAQRNPDMGYVYPAGGRQGTTFQVAIGGQYLDGVTNVDVAGGGIEAVVIEHVKPLNGKQINLMRDRLKELQEGLSTAGGGERRIEVRSAADTNAVERMDRASAEAEVAEIKKKLANPKNRNPANAQLAEDVILRVELAPDAEPGPREVRLKTALGLSNPLPFHVGRLPEFSEKEPNNKAADKELPALPPLVINGQIMPGDVDRFRLTLRQGARLVVTVSARELIPYLADAVPGWFQATVGLCDATGREVAYADDYRFHPDPVLFYEIPGDGDYVLEVKDAIYRGREDFVYRLTVGEMPFITSIFPLGGPVGARTTVELQGWNLPGKELAVEPRSEEAGVQSLAVRQGEWDSNRVPFAADTLPEGRELEPNNATGAEQSITLPFVVNGRIDPPGDVDIFRIQGRAGEVLVAEVYARRLNSPLDSVLRLTDAAGRSLAFSDDQEDKGAGLTTHHADARLSLPLPQDGTYLLHLGDAQQKGGGPYGYRLRISPPRPDFELRVVPPSLNVRPGASVPLTVYALRKDGFSNEIVLTLKDAPPGFTLSGGRMPPNQDQVRLTFKAPPRPVREPFSLSLEGRATIQGREMIRRALPAEDMMQAFIYRHLVPATELRVAVIGRGNPPASAKGGGPQPPPLAPAQKRKTP